MKTIKLLISEVVATPKCFPHVLAFRSARCLFLLLLVLLGNQSLLAQSPDVHWTDHGTFRVGYELSTGSAVFLADQQFSVRLHLETQRNIECLGAHFDVEFSALVEPQSNSIYSIPEGNWLGAASELVVETGQGPSQGAVRWSVSRPSGQFRSGGGCILTLNFKVKDQAVLATDLIRALDGGLIMVDNIDMKQAAPIAIGASTSVFPNPFTDEITVDLQGRENVQVRIFDLSGNVVYTSRMSHQEQLDLRTLPSGMYFLEVFDGKSIRPQVFRIVKE